MSYHEPARVSAPLPEPPQVAKHDQRRQLSLHWQTITHCGYRKPKNEDAFGACELLDGIAKPLPSSGIQTLSADRELAFFVSDGMGGAKAGERASRMVIDGMCDLHLNEQDTDESHIEDDQAFIRMNLLCSALDRAHTEVNRIGSTDPECKGMGATMIGGWFFEHKMVWLHVGDSRIYLLRDGNLRQLTEDQKQAWRLYRRGIISEDDYLRHPQRNLLDQAVGAGVPSLFPQFEEEDIQAGDIFILCSDGMVDGIREADIQNVLKNCDSTKETASRLMQQALDAGGKDNITITMIEAMS